VNVLKLAIRKIRHFLRYPALRAEENAMLLAGLRLERILGPGKVGSLREVELKVFSQWGEDGIIQYLIHRIPIENDTFIEFGVEDYRESNTRFLLRNDNWRGLVIDGDPLNIRSIRDERISTYHDLKSVCSFVTRENINGLIAGAGLSGDIGILSIDIDGNDYWVWEAIDVVSPRIVVCEYNAIFGAGIAVTVPYDPGFTKERGHYSGLYFGASLPALCLLADRKGYEFVGCTSAGNDAFFVRKDLAGHVNTTNAMDGFVSVRARDSRGTSGEKTFLSGDDCLQAISHLPVCDIRSGKIVPLQTLLG
jgi:hypothetical protein